MVARLGSRTGVCSDRRVDLEAHHYSGRVGNMLLFPGLLDGEVRKFVEDHGNNF